MPTDPAAPESDLAGLADLELPTNVVLGRQSRIVADDVSKRAVFGRFRSERMPAIEIGERSLVTNVSLNLEKAAHVRIGNGCELNACFLISGESIFVGNRVFIGWHATIVDSDFHPTAPKLRRQDVSPSHPRQRPKRVRKSWESPW